MAFLKELITSFLALPCRPLICQVLFRKRRQKSWNDAPEEGIGISAAGEVLDQEHAKPVAFIVETVKLGLDMDPETVESHLLGLLDVEEIFIIALRRIIPDEIVSLVQQSG